jgi:cytochrome c
MSGDLELNKILGAGLATALVILGLREISDHMFSQEPPKKAGYAIAVTEEAGPGAAKPDVPPDWGTVLKTADTAQGQTVFAKCQSCHNDAAGAGDKIGPDLFGVVGRAVASEAGFAYSDAMKDHAKKAGTWTYDNLYTYLSNPQAVVPGTKMTFVGDHDSTDRINLIAYLRAQGSTGYAIPAPDPKRQAAAAPAAGAPAAAGAAAPAAAGAAAPAPATNAAAPAAAAPAKK